MTILEILDKIDSYIILGVSLPILFVLIKRHVAALKAENKALREQNETLKIFRVSGVEKDVVQLGDIYTWDVETDQITRTMYPIILKEKIAQGTGVTKKRINTEIYIRERILKYMVDNDIRDNKEVISLFQRYHNDPKNLIAEIKAKKGIVAEE